MELYIETINISSTHCSCPQRCCSALFARATIKNIFHPLLESFLFRMYLNKQLNVVLYESYSQSTLKPKEKVTDLKKCQPNRQLIYIIFPKAGNSETWVLPERIQLECADAYVGGDAHIYVCLYSGGQKITSYVIPQVSLTVLLRQTLLSDWNHQFGYNGRQSIKFKDHTLSVSPAQRL